MKIVKIAKVFFNHRYQDGRGLLPLGFAGDPRGVESFDFGSGLAKSALFSQSFSKVMLSI